MYTLYNPMYISAVMMTVNLSISSLLSSPHPSLPNSYLLCPLCPLLFHISSHMSHPLPSLLTYTHLISPLLTFPQFTSSQYLLTCLSPHHRISLHGVISSPISPILPLHLATTIPAYILALSTYKLNPFPSYSDVYSFSRIAGVLFIILPGISTLLSRLPCASRRLSRAVSHYVSSPRLTYYSSDRLLFPQYNINLFTCREI